MLDLLSPFVTDEKLELGGFTGRWAVAGERPPLTFIATEDHRGQVEISLSLPGPRRPTSAHAAAFFRVIGVDPVSEARARLTRHFVLRGPVQ